VFSSRSMQPMPGAWFYWGFGDGGTGTGVDPDHTYAGSGIYYVCTSAWWIIPGTSDTCHLYHLRIRDHRWRWFALRQHLRPIRCVDQRPRCGLRERSFTARHTIHLELR
jgi:hypothetical protein